MRSRRGAYLETGKWVPLLYMCQKVEEGVTDLIGNQIFYQLIWRKGNPKFPRGIHEIIPWFSEAPVGTYRALGISAEYQSVNDIGSQEGKKNLTIMKRELGTIPSREEITLVLKEQFQK